MELKETFRQIFEKVGTTQAEASKYIDRTPKLMNDRLSRDTLRYGEYLKILDTLGIDLVFVPKEGEELRVKEDPLTAIVEHSNTTMAKVGKIIGKPPQKFRERIESGLFRATEFIEICESLGYEIKYVIRKTGESISFKARGHGRRVCAMVNGVIYNTNQSRAVSNSFFADGINEYTDGRASELYQDDEGRYFLVDYTNFEGVKDRVIPLTAEDAQKFIDKYGYIE